METYPKFKYPSSNCIISKFSICNSTIFTSFATLDNPIEATFCMNNLPKPCYHNYMQKESFESVAGFRRLAKVSASTHPVALPLVAPLRAACCTLQSSRFAQDALTATSSSSSAAAHQLATEIEQMGVTAQ